MRTNSNHQTEKLPPHNLEAERAILGSILLDSKSLNGCIDRVNSKHFYHNGHQIIFDCITGLIKAEIIPDVVTVCDSLKSSKKLDTVGGYVYLLDLVENLPSSANVSYYIDSVIELSERRNEIETLKSEIEKLQNSQSEINKRAYRGSIKSLVMEFIDGTTGDFSRTEVGQFVTERVKSGQAGLTGQYRTSGTMDSVRKVLLRALEKNIIKKSGTRDGIYKRVESDTNEIDIFSADPHTLNIKWPFRIQDLVNIFQKSVIVIAGEPNSGKTGMALNVAIKNCDEFPVTYFSSEMGAIELRQRIEKFKVPLTYWKKVKFIERAADFADVIDPAGFNIIDFLEIHDNFYIIGSLLTQIYNKLTNGVALVLIQKNPGRDSGLGGARGLEKPRLYLSMEPGKLKIVKGKNWASELTNPNGLQINFKLAGGCNFIKEGEWYRETK